MSRINQHAPKDVPQYIEWLKKNHNIIIDGKAESYYDTVKETLRKKIEENQFWVTLKQNLRDINDEYLLEKKYHLFNQLVSPDILTKSYDSFLQKTFRKNVLENKNWPNEPRRGWISPDNWFERINDVVRTTFVVKYLDGVEFFSNKINTFGKDHGFHFTVNYAAKEEGYYAAHIYLNNAFEIIDNNFNKKEIKFNFEIQITTQLQEIIKSLLHKYYEETRTKFENERNKKWQWDYKCEEFSANYLGHILHYVEGMVVEIRDRQNSNQEIIK